MELDLASYSALAPGAPAGRRAAAGTARLRLPENLAAKLRAARAAGADRVDIYHYGLAPLTALDRVREALALAEQPVL